MPGASLSFMSCGRDKIWIELFELKSNRLPFRLANMIPISEAIKIVLQQTPRLAEVELISLSDSRGRILAEDIIADTDLPPFDRAQMDGYALRAADVANTPARLTIVGESAAGAGWHHEMKAGEAVRIMTGAPVPTGADAVQQVELTQEIESGSVVEILNSVEAGRSIVRQADEIKSGETVLRAGEEISAAMIATLASFGYAQVKVGRRPRVAVMATGSNWWMLIKNRRAIRFASRTTIRLRPMRHYQARSSNVCPCAVMTPMLLNDK